MKVPGLSKKFVLGILLALVFLSGLLCFRYADAQRVVLLLGADGVPCIAVNTEQSSSTILLWQDAESGTAYFFLPSCVRRRSITVGDLGSGSLRIEGEPLREGDVFTWEDGRTYAVQVADSARGVYDYAVAVMRSENIPAVFIDTASGGMAYLEEDKAHEETGAIRVVDGDGNTEYQGALERISGRGNSTWGFAKKPYTIKLTEKYPLCGLEKGDKWNLLSLWREGSKLDNKIAMDLAEELGLPYSPQGVWVDLYLNGEYAGNYLLAESVSVGEGRVEITDLERENRAYNKDIMAASRYVENNNKGYILENGSNITGGYLIEKDYAPYYRMENNGFVTSMCNTFTIKAPQHASKEQVHYIRDYVEHIEQLVQNGQPQVWDYLDIDSFVKRFLVDELSMEIDAGVTSMYFYKERDDDKLYSGPVWDYDSAFGDGASAIRNGYDYQYTTLENCADAYNCLNWYTKLYETPEVQQRLREEYEKILPVCERLLGQQIDEYVRTIYASVEMDRLRWSYREEARYADYDANVKYTKYYMAQRLNWLCERWDVAHEPFPTPCSGQTPTVTFEDSEGGPAVVMEVLDGDQLAEPPEYDEAVYQGWRNRATGEVYRRQIPIYEDTVFYNERRE